MSSIYRKFEKPFYILHINNNLTIVSDESKTYISFSLPQSNSYNRYALLLIYTAALIFLIKLFRTV